MGRIAGVLAAWLLGLSAALAQPAPYNYPAAGGSGGSSSCSGDINAACSQVLGVGNVTTGVLPATHGGTGQASAAAARGSAGLDIDELTGHGDSNYTILSTDRVVATNAAFTAARTWTLPAASALNAGQTVTILDAQGTLTATNTLTIARAGTDTIEGGTSIVLSVVNTGVTLVSDGVSKWTIPQSAWIGGIAIDASGNVNLGNSGKIQWPGVTGSPALSASAFAVNSSGSLGVGNGSSVFWGGSAPTIIGSVNGNSGGGLQFAPFAGTNNRSSETYVWQFSPITLTLTAGYALDRATQFLQNTYTAGSAQTLTEADSVSVVGAPIAAGSAAISKSVGLHVQAGSSVSAGVTTAVGLVVDPPTGAATNLGAQLNGVTQFPNAGSGIALNADGLEGTGGNGINIQSAAFNPSFQVNKSGGSLAMYYMATQAASSGAEAPQFGGQPYTHTITAGYANQRFDQLPQNTITAASALSISTEADTAVILGPPIAAGSATLAKSIGLHIAAGSSLTSGATVGVGLKVDAPTGAGANKSMEISGHQEYTGSSPTLSACGTSPSIVGNDEAGRVTVGTSPSTTCTLTFASGNWTNAPVCFAQDETTGVTMRVSTVAVGSVTFTSSATLTAADKISYHCVGFF